MCCIDSLKRLGYKKIEGMQENPKGLPAKTREGCTCLLMPTLHQQRCKVAISRDVQPCLVLADKALWHYIGAVLSP